MNKMTVKINQEGIKEYYKRTRITYLLYSLIGLLLIGGFVTAVVFNEGWIRVLSIVGIALVGFITGISVFLSIVLTVTVVSSKSVNRTNEITFNLDHMIVVSYENGEKKEESKVYYNELDKYIVTRNYVFAVLKQNKGTLSFNRDEKIISLFEEKHIQRKKM